jgi:hypothetical protein
MGMDGPASNLPLVTHEEFPFIHPMQAPSHPRKETAYEPLGTITIYNTLPLSEGYIPSSIMRAELAKEASRCTP